MIEKENVKEISFDFLENKIEFILKKPIHINNYFRTNVTKKGTYEEYVGYVNKLNCN